MTNKILARETVGNQHQSMTDWSPLVQINADQQLLPPFIT